MAAAPKLGTFALRSINGEGRMVDTYISDVANANANFDNGSGVAASTSDTFFIMPFDGYVEDFSVATGLTDTTAGQITANGVPIGSTIRWANQLNSLNNRPRLNVPIRKGTAIRMVQRA